MSFDWLHVTLSDIAEINPRRPIAKATNAPFIDMAAISTHARDVERLVPFKEYKGSGSKFWNGDTLVARITPCLENGKTALVRCLPANTIGHGSTEFIVLGPRKESDSSFVYYLARSPAFRNYAISRMEGTSGRQRVPNSAVANYSFFCPPPEERANIGNLLSSLDDRITLLRETNKTLESIAQAIFKSWFIDFDPVRAKMEGHQPEGMDEDTAALFPDSFEESELGLVPRGWQIRTFLETVDVIGGGTPKTSNSDYWNGGIPWFSVVDAPELSDVWVVRTEKKISEKGLNESSTKLLPVGTTIISARGTVGKLALTGREMAMNQSCYGLRGKYDDVFFTYFSTKRLVDSLRQHSHGSVFDTITKDTLSRVKVVLPAIACLEKFEQVVDLVMKQMLAQSERGYCISQIRDTLLPRLISGQLRLPEAQEKIEAALL
ncbi:MAG: restriction endonuclease subunit S [Pusillimonas sp.]